MVFGKSYNFEERILRESRMGVSGSNSLNSVQFKGIFDHKNKRTRLLDKGNLDKIYNIDNKLEIVKHNKIEHIDIIMGTMIHFDSYEVLKEISIYYNLNPLILKYATNFKNIKDLTSSKGNKLLLPIYDSKHLKRLYKKVENIEKQIEKYILNYILGYEIVDNKHNFNLLSELDNELGRYLPYRK